MDTTAIVALLGAAALLITALTPLVLSVMKRGETRERMRSRDTTSDRTVTLYKQIIAELEDENTRLCEENATLAERLET